MTGLIKKAVNASIAAVKVSEAERLKTIAQKKREDSERLNSIAARLQGTAGTVRNRKSVRRGTQPDDWAKGPRGNIWCPIWDGKPVRWGLRQIVLGRGSEPKDVFVSIPAERFEDAILALSKLALKLAQRAMTDLDNDRVHLLSAYGLLLAELPKQARQKATGLTQRARKETP